MMAIVKKFLRIFRSLLKSYNCFNTIEIYIVFLLDYVKCCTSRLVSRVKNRILVQINPKLLKATFWFWVPEKVFYLPKI